MKVFHAGVLLVGPSGIGKSEALLELVTRGHSFVADDMVLLFQKNKKLIATATKNLGTRLHLRDVGILDMQKMFPVKQICKEVEIRLVIELAHAPQDQYKWVETTRRPRRNYLAVSVPIYHITVAPMRHLAVLIETIVRWDQAQRKKVHS